MKIKTKKKLNLHELIEYVWENDFSIKGFMVFKSDCDKFEVRISSHMLDYVWDKSSKFSSLTRGTTFTVEVEEELTEDTVIQGLADVFFDPLVGGPNVEYHTDCIKNIKQDAMETYSLAIFYKDTIVWSRESGIPESGVLEVDTE